MEPVLDALFSRGGVGRCSGSGNASTVLLLKASFLENPYGLWLTASQELMASAWSGPKGAQEGLVCDSGRTAGSLGGGGARPTLPGRRPGVRAGPLSREGGGARGCVHGCGTNILASASLLLRGRDGTRLSLPGRGTLGDLFLGSDLVLLSYLSVPGCSSHQHGCDKGLCVQPRPD